MAVKVQCPACSAVYSVFEPTVGRRVRCPQCNELVEAAPYVPGARVVKPTLAKLVLDLAESQGLLDGKAIIELRKQLAESKFVVTPEAIAKVLVDHGHLTPFQARKLVSQALTPEAEPEPRPEPPRATRPAPKDQGREVPSSMRETVDLTFADDERSESLAATEEEIIDLESVEPEAPRTKRPAWKTGGSVPPPAERGMEVTEEELVALEPVTGLDAVPLTPLNDLQPINDLVPISAPVASPLIPMPGPLEVAALPAYGAKKNVWDSPFLLIGGGVLGVILVAFVVLLYVLTRGTAADILNKAEGEYRSGSYANAIAGYETFLKRYPDNPEASKARVSRGMAKLRQVSDDGKNPRLALQIAKEVLPDIEKEAAFNDARLELVSILPDIADGLATLALRADEGKPKEELVNLTKQAMELVNNAAYLPASLRKGQERRIVGIVDKLRTAERGMKQDQDLAGTIAKIQAAADKGEIAEAYRLRAELLRTYPALEANTTLLAAMRKVSEKERSLVKVAAAKVAAKTDDPAGASKPIILADRKGPAPVAGKAKPVFVLVEGAVYGVDASSGEVLWRRYLGYGSNSPPITLAQEGGADALLVDSAKHEVLRVRGSTGQLMWRQPLGETVAGVTIAGKQIIATTRDGRVVELDAATGGVVHSAQLPQGATLAAAIDAKQGRIVQLGENATLYVLAADSLNCTETYFLDHKPGAVFVPPVAALDHVLTCESPGDDYSLVRVLGWDAKTKRMVQVGQPFRLKGRVVTPMTASGRFVAAVTDLGQIAMYEIDATNAQEPVRVVAGVEAGESSPIGPFYVLSGNRLWVANHRCSLFELQTAVQKLAREWTVHPNDTFLAPLQLEGDVVVHARRKQGVAGVIVEGCNAIDSNSRWTTRLAAPVAALAPSEPRKSIAAITTGGLFYSLGAEQFSKLQIEQPTFGAGGAAGTIFSDAALTPDGATLVWTETQAGGKVYSYGVTAGTAPIATPLPGASALAAAPAQLFAGRLLVPLTNGSVALLEPGTGRQLALPFMPALTPGSLPAWSRPAIGSDGRSFVISDGRRALYAVALKDQPQPALIGGGESQIDGTLVSPLVAVGGTGVAVVRTDSADSLVRIDLQNAAGLELLPLEGALQAGPFAVGGMILFAAGDNLVALDANAKPRWQQPLAHGPLAGSPLAIPGGDLLVVHQSGIVRRLDSAAGKELSQVDVKQPLGPAACILGQEVFLGGSDGAIHRIPLPPKP